MSTAVVYLIVHLFTHPSLPGVIVGAFTTEGECVAAANSLGLIYQLGMQADGRRVRWTCEVRT